MSMLEELRPMTVGDAARVLGIDVIFENDNVGQFILRVHAADSAGNHKHICAQGFHDTNRKRHLLQ